MLLTDIEPLKALEIFYEGEESGVWEGEFIKNEKERGLIYPPKLKEFLLRFGYFRVNSGECRFWFPNDVQVIDIPFEGESREMLLVGKWGQQLVGIFSDECNMNNPPISLGETAEPEDGRDVLTFGYSGMFLKDVLTYFFVENLYFHSGGTFYTEPKDIKKISGKYPARLCKGEKSLNDLLTNSQRPYECICYDEEEKQFICLDLGQDNDYIFVFPQSITTDELESLFKREFYENSMNCDFTHALSLAEKIIDRLEREALNLGEKYRLAGRCCWKLNQWDKAEEWLKKAEPIYNLKSTPVESTQSFYQGLGNFYSDMGDEEKSAAAYEKADRLADSSGKDGCRLKGDRLLRKGMELAEKDCLEEAIEYFEKALSEYQKNPKECKYDIARCGQLKGDAKHKLKERKKQSNQ